MTTRALARLVVNEAFGFRLLLLGGFRRAAAKQILKWGVGLFGAYLILAYFLLAREEGLGHLDSWCACHTQRTHLPCTKWARIYPLGNHES